MYLEFQHNNYDIRATYQYDIREDGKYLGNIDFEVCNEIGEDVTCDLSSTELLNIHTVVVERAQLEVANAIK